MKKAIRHIEPQKILTLLMFVVSLVLLALSIIS